MYTDDYIKDTSNKPLREKRSYTKALKDVYEWLDMRAVAIKQYGADNYECVMAFLKMFIDDPEPLMEFGDMAKYEDPQVVVKKIEQYFKNKKEGGRAHESCN